MTQLWNRPWTGGLFGWREPSSIVSRLEQPGVVISELGVDRWRSVTYRTKKPLLEALPETMEYEYQFFLRLSGPHALLAGTEGRLVEEFVSRCNLGVGMFTPRVHVDRLVEMLASSADDRFLMGGIFARVEGYGNSLRSVALWGADIADAELFQRIKMNLLPYRVELRDVTRGTHILSISSRGEVGFNYDGPESLANVTQTLRVLTNEGYVEWPL